MTDQRSKLNMTPAEESVFEAAEKREQELIDKPFLSAEELRELEKLSNALNTLQREWND